MNLLRQATNLIRTVALQAVSAYAGGSCEGFSKKVENVRVEIEKRKQWGHWVVGQENKEFITFSHAETLTLLEFVQRFNSYAFSQWNMSYCIGLAKDAGVIDSDYNIVDRHAKPINGAAFEAARRIKAEGLQNYVAARQVERDIMGD